MSEVNLDKLFTFLDGVEKERKAQKAFKKPTPKTKGKGGHTENGEPVVYRVGNKITFVVAEACRWSDHYNLRIETFYCPRVAENGILVAWGKDGKKYIVDNNIKLRHFYAEQIIARKISVKPKGKDYSKIRA